MLITNSVIGDPHAVRWEISRAGFTVGIIEKQAVSYRAEGIPPPTPSPRFGNGSPPGPYSTFWGLYFPPLRLSYTQTVRLLNNFSNIASLADPEKLSIRNIRPVSHHRGHRRHTIVALAACFAFYQSCQKLSGCIRQRITALICSYLYYVFLDILRHFLLE